MFSDLFAKWGAYLISGLIIAILATGGGLWLKHVYDQNVTLKQEKAQLEKDNKKLTETMKNDLKTDARTEARKRKIDNLPVDQLINEWDRLRRYKSGADEDPPSE